MEVINPLRFLKDQTYNTGDPEIKKLVLASGDKIDVVFWID